MIYVGIARPYVHEKFNNLELANASFTLLAGYSLVVFSDYTDNGKRRYQYAWVLIGLIALVCLINVIVQTGTTWDDVMPKLKQKYYQKRAEKIKAFRAK